MATLLCGVADKYYQATSSRDHCYVAARADDFPQCRALAKTGFQVTPSASIAAWWPHFTLRREGPPYGKRLPYRNGIASI
jgi:hypothetical protein